MPLEIAPCAREARHRLAQRAGVGGGAGKGCRTGRDVKEPDFDALVRPLGDVGAAFGCVEGRSERREAAGRLDLAAGVFVLVGGGGVAVLGVQGALVGGAALIGLQGAPGCGVQRHCV